MPLCTAKFPSYSLRDLLLSVALCALYLGTYVHIINIVLPERRFKTYAITVVFAIASLVLTSVLRTIGDRQTGKVQFRLPALIPWRPLLTTVSVSCMAIWLIGSAVPSGSVALVPMFILIVVSSARLIVHPHIVVGTSGVSVPFYGFRPWSRIDATIMRSADGLLLTLTLDKAKRRVAAIVPERFVETVLSTFQRYGSGPGIRSND
jgi:hypothetical protein